jgi:hypothetical protein
MHDDPPIRGLLVGETRWRGRLGRQLALLGGGATPWSYPPCDATAGQTIIAKNARRPNLLLMRAPGLTRECPGAEASCPRPSSKRCLRILTRINDV